MTISILEYTNLKNYILFCRKFLRKVSLKNKGKICPWPLCVVDKVNTWVLIFYFYKSLYIWGIRVLLLAQPGQIARLGCT